LPDVAIAVLGSATVSENSIIEGEWPSKPPRTARRPLASTIQGRVQKLQSAVVRDLGQTVWR
jgi:hypothetical protein